MVSALMELPNIGDKTAVRGFTVMLLLSTMTPSATVAAQRIPPFEVGEVLRITAPECGIEEQVARYLRLYRDTLTVSTGSELKVPVARVTELDVSRGLSNRSTLIGISAGAFVGMVLGIALASDGGTEISGGDAGSHTTRPWIPSSGGGGQMGSLSGAAVAPIAAAFIGGMVGGMVGKAIRRHRWEEVPLERLQASAGPQGDGRLALGLSVSF